MVLSFTDPERARNDLRSRAQLLMAHFNAIYQTPEHGRLIHGYIREHLFLSLKRNSLPVHFDDDTVKLFGIALHLTLTFFSEGKAAAIGWPASMTEDVQDDLEQVIRYTLLVPATRTGWQDAWTQRLRQMAEGLPRREQGRSTSSATGATATETGVAGEGKGEGKQRESHQATDLAQIAQQANALVEGAEDGGIKKGAISLRGLPSANSPRPIGGSGLATQHEQNEAASYQQEEITTGSVIDGVRISDAEMAMQESLLADIRKRKERDEAENKWSDRVAKRIANEAGRRANWEMVGMMNRSGMDNVDWDADDEDGLDEDGGFLNPFTDEREAPGGKIIEKSGKNVYRCEMCGKVLDDADALNEHYLLHFAD